MNIVLVNGILLLASAVLALRLFPETRSNSWGLLALAGFLYICLIVAIQSVLGWSDMLSRTSVSVASYVIGGFVLLRWGRGSIRSISDMRFDTDRLTRFIIGAGLLLLILELFNALVTPVWEYDSIAYHLPMARHWYLTGSLRSVAFSVFAGPVSYYPGTGELLTLWTMLLQGTDQYANVPNVLLFPLFFVTGVFALQNRGIPVRYAIFFPALFLLTPLVLKQIGTPLVDLLFAYEFLSILLFLDIFIREKRPEALVLCVAGLGLFIGTKYLAIPYAPIILVPLGIAVVLHLMRRATNRHPLIIALIAGCIAALLLGGHWYIRNFLLTGNPLFPATVSIGSLTLLEGYGAYMDQIVDLSYLRQQSSFSQEDKEVINTVLFRRVGYGLFAFLAAYISALVILAKTSVSYTKHVSQHSLFLLFIVIALPYGVYMYISAPYTANFDANLRYILPVLLLAYLLLVELCSRARGAGYWLLVTILIAEVLSVIGFIHGTDLPFETFTFRYAFQSPWLFVGYAVAVFLSVIWSFALWRFLPRLGLPVLFLLVPTALISGTESIAQVRSATTYETLTYKYPFQSDLFGAFVWIDQHADSDSVIAYTGFHLQYPLLHRSLHRDVRYVPVNDCVDCDYADFRSNDNGIFSNADPLMWLRNLQDARVTYLVYYDDMALQRHVSAWITQFPRHFTVKYRSGEVTVYGFIP